MPCNDHSKNEVWSTLDSLREEWEAVNLQLCAVQDRIKAIIDTLDWTNDQDLIQEIIYRLPRASVLRLHMYDRLSQLSEDQEPDTSETPAQDENGK
jgi:hypothetical protein